MSLSGVEPANLTRKLHLEKPVIADFSNHLALENKGFNRGSVKSEITINQKIMIGETTLKSGS
jgi:hypothetical protein